MTDRELLEAAARAAEYSCVWRGGDGDFWWHVDPDIARPWNPLTDDGDALRLAVKLIFVVAVKGHECEVFSETGECLASVPIMGASCFANIAEATNPYAATRRAIVRAAAEMAPKG